VPAVRTFAARWAELPSSWSADGRLSATLRASGRTALERAEMTARLEPLELSNEPGTVVADRTTLAARAVLTPAAGGRYAVDSRIEGVGGQALAGPVLLDFTREPLTVDTQGLVDPVAADLHGIVVTQRGLVEATGEARVRLGEVPALERGRFSIEALEFPAAYTSLLQIALAAGDFGDLETAGRVTGEATLAENALTRLSARIEGVRLEDRRGQFFLEDLRGTLHWSPDPSVDVPVSRLAWRAGGAYGFSGGAADVAFRARGDAFALAEPARLPVFDGAIAIRELAFAGLGGEAASVDFDAEIEPISLPRITGAFGWPEMQGQIAGRIPGLSLRGNELRVAGDVEAKVFDGRIVGSGIRIVDALGPWPRFYADVRARGLDLELVTRTFSFGTITGRLDADVLGLELFNWSPVAFDARLETSSTDRTRHRISAKAVKELANIGGGGGGVAEALQSGALRFFDEYSYDRIGLRCRLVDDVCLMSGIEPAGNGYYIVKGRGIPRIDIIGNEGRVAWPQLVAQLVAGMETSDDVVVK
jgi:hypothetical protein